MTLPRVPRGISIAFTVEELGWLTWVMADVMKHSDSVNYSARKKILDAALIFATATEALAGNDNNETKTDHDMESG